MFRAIVENILIALAAAVLMVTSVLPINVIVFFAWLANLVYIASRAKEPACLRQRVLAAQVATFMTVTMAAYLALSKLSETQFSRQIALPKTALTVAELDALAKSASRDDLPVRLTLAYGEATSAQTLKFPSREISLGEFIRIVEDQSPLRGHFIQCGNAYTILWGNPASSSMMLTEESPRN